MNQLPFATTIEVQDRKIDLREMERQLEYGDTGLLEDTLALTSSIQDRKNIFQIIQAINAARRQDDPSLGLAELTVIDYPEHEVPNGIDLGLYLKRKGGINRVVYEEFDWTVEGKEHRQPVILGWRKSK